MVLLCCGVQAGVRSVLLVVVVALLVVWCAAQGNGNQRIRMVEQEGNINFVPENFPLDCNPNKPCPHSNQVCFHFTQSRGRPFRCLPEELVPVVSLTPVICPLVCPCRHGSCTTLTASSFTCQCETGFKGTLCEEST